MIPAADRWTVTPSAAPALAAARPKTISAVEPRRAASCSPPPFIGRQVLTSAAGNLHRPVEDSAHSGSALGPKMAALSSGSPNHFTYILGDPPDLKRLARAAIHDEAKVLVVRAQRERQKLVREETIEHRQIAGRRTNFAASYKMGRSPKKTSELRSSTRWMPAW